MLHPGRFAGQLSPPRLSRAAAIKRQSPTMSGMDGILSPRTRSNISKRQAPTTPGRRTSYSKARKEGYQGGRDNINAILASCGAARDDAATHDTEDSNCDTPPSSAPSGVSSSPATTTVEAAIQPNALPMLEQEAVAATSSSWEDKVIGNPTVMLQEEAQPTVEDTVAAPSSCKDARNSADHGSEMETEAAADATVEVAEESVELPEPRLLSWDELGTRQFEVAHLLRLKIEPTEKGILSTEETVVAIARFMARLAIAATLREDKDTGILYQELLAGKGPDHMKAGASSLREAVRIKVQDNKDVETACVAVSEALELFHGLRSHARERGETLEQCWKSLSL